MVPEQCVALGLKLAATFEVISSRQSAWKQFNNLGTSPEKPRFGRAARQSKELKKKALFWPRILVQKTAPEARSITSFIKPTVGWGGPRGGPEIRTVFVCFFFKFFNVNLFMSGVIFFSEVLPRNACPPCLCALLH